MDEPKNEDPGNATNEDQQSDEVYDHIKPPEPDESRTNNTPDIPESFINQPAIHNNEPSMIETHANDLHKVPGKGWKHLLFEFLMLFLAVFAGFLAENEREHFIEHKREKKFMRTLVGDLQKDTMNFNRSIRIFQGNVDDFNRIKSSLKNPGTAKQIADAYQSILLPQRFSSFNYTDRTVEQLRAAGNFRLIRNEAVADSITEYDRYIRNTFLSLEQIVSARSQEIMQLQNEIFDREAAFQQPAQPLLFINNEKKLLLKHYNNVVLYISFCSRFIRHNQTAKERATNLIKLIRQEYDIR